MLLAATAIFLYYTAWTLLMVRLALLFSLSLYASFLSSFMLLKTICEP